ncbi:uncharacterized protein LTR77_002197 [Saxophila tyrrhenica]|uniref:Xylanolytic transcriptional activator regulatory domain-containing protein n=1 Tax=Saxophila tyrrhenica TaxID=1690608 RepID=A0AAV9PMG9_9PEZI|nr:hypothetical protein LTR77_002197 [Saxophila tyrrhenica]
MRMRTVADYAPKAENGKQRRKRRKLGSESPALESIAEPPPDVSLPHVEASLVSDSSSQLPDDNPDLSEAPQEALQSLHQGPHMDLPDAYAFDWELTDVDLVNLFNSTGEAEPLHFWDPWALPFPGYNDAPIVVPNMDNSAYVGQPAATDLRGPAHECRPNPGMSDTYAVDGSSFGVLEESRRSEPSGEGYSGELHEAAVLLGESYDIVKARIEPLLGQVNCPPYRVLKRWLEAYFRGFHPHMPFLHIPTLKLEFLEPSVVLAILSIGALYCLERDRAWAFYQASCAAVQIAIKSRNPSSGGEDLQTLQCLLLNVSFAAWSGDCRTFEESQGDASRLVIMLHNEAQRRESGNDHFKAPSTAGSWIEFIQLETFRRLYFCVFALGLTITEVYGVSAPIILADCAIALPSSEAEWTASSEQRWCQFYSANHVATPNFRTALTAYLSCTDESAKDAQLIAPCYSSLGGHVLILSIFMQTYHLSVAKRSQNPRTIFHADEVVITQDLDISEAPSAFKEQFLDKSQITNLKRALKRWQSGWRLNSEAMMSPTNPCGPISFNSTTHFRVTNLRLYSDFTSVRRALRTQDAHRVFQAIAGISGSPIQRTADMTETTYPAIAALQIPIRTGVRVFAHTASLTWSIEHFLTGFECALFLAFYLLSLERDADSDLSDEEVEMQELVSNLIDESGEECVRSHGGRAILSVSVLRLWASIFNNVCVWGGESPFRNGNLYLG